ncbi:MAG: hypothetical protein AMXMBFR66_06420 [Pseudomonadota bacterium]|nr:serine/threonine protein kinase [Rubrivivax sp.]
MTLGVAELKRLAPLLDEALELEGAAREAWLERLAQDDAALAERLRRLLAAGMSTASAAALDRGLALGIARPPAGSRVPGPGDGVGPYRLQRLLAQGGMGEVWLAARDDGSSQRAVALKLPVLGLRRDVLVRRFEREREILESLSHPHIARLYDAGFAADGQPYLALEYVPGEPIDRYCEACRLDARRRVQLMQQVLAAVQFAHANLVVHRDLKPSNVLVTPEGHAMLLDFGIAKLLQPEDARAVETELTRLGGRALTPDYAAPEQVRSEPVSIATDIWALGVLLYRLLAGELPFRGAHRAELEQAILSAAPLRPSQHRQGVAARLARHQAADLDTIVGKALHKAPAERYATVDALADDLGRWMDGQPVHAQPDRLGYRLRKFVARHRAGSAAAAAALAAVAVAGSSALWQARTARQEAEHARQEARRAQAVQDFLLDIFRANSREQTDPMRAQQTTARELLDAGAARIDRALADAPEARLQLLGALSDLYLELGLRGRAVDLARRRVELARAVLARDDARRAHALLALARFLHDGMYREQARALLTEARAVLDAGGGADAAVRARLLAQWVRFYRYESLREYIAGADRALAFERAQPGPGLSLVRALQAAGLAHLSQLDYARAEPLLAEGYAEAHRRVADRAMAIVTIGADTAEVWQSIGRFAEAEHALREAIAESTRINGAEHGVTLVFRSHLAYLLLQTGRSSEGREEQRAIRATIGANDARYDASWRRNLEYLLARHLIDGGAAAPLAALLEPEIGPLAEDLPRSGVLVHRLRQLAEAYTALGRLDEADARLTRAEALWARYADGADAPWTRLNLSHARARLLLRQGRPTEAAAVLEAMPAAQLPDGALDIYALKRDVALAEARLATGQPEQARALARSTLERLAGLAPAWRLPHLESLAWRALGKAQAALGEAAAGRDSLRQALRIRSASDEASSPWPERLRGELAEMSEVRTGRR